MTSSRSTNEDESVSRWSEFRSRFFDNRETDWIKLIAIITVVALTPIAVFAVLTTAGYFPTELLGGVAASATIASISGFCVVIGGSVIWIRWDSSKKNSKNISNDTPTETT
ncbi:MAG: hypothetical protein KDK55_06900 [Chlamydiia bacterium]|nr:hypothetical protein [Chlamydiia bacterium]